MNDVQAAERARGQETDVAGVDAKQLPGSSLHGDGKRHPVGFSMSVVGVRRTAGAGEGLVPVELDEISAEAVVGALDDAGQYDGGAVIHMFSPHLFAKRVYVGTSMVVCRVVRLDGEGRETDLTDVDVDRLKSVLHDGQNYHIAMPGRQELIVLLLMSRPVLPRQQPIHDTGLKGLFNRAALGASALLEGAIAAAGMQIASEAVLPASNRHGTPSYEKGEENGRGFRRALNFKRVSGLAAVPVLGFRQEVQVPLGSNIQDERFGHPAFVSRRALYSPEELASYAPAPENALDQDEATSFLARLRSPQYRTELMQRFAATHGELASFGGLAARLRPVPAEELENALGDMAAFSENLAMVNKMRTDAGLPPVGYRSQPFGMAHSNDEVISDPIELFRFKAKSMFLGGEFHAALLSGGPPTELVVPMDQLGWRPLEGGLLRGGVPWEASGPRVAWIEPGKDQLLLDLQAVLQHFRQAGLKRCVDLCVRPAHFAQLMAGAGLLSGTSTSATTRSIESTPRSVYRLKFKSFFLG